MEKANWDVLVSIVTRVVLKRADENGYASLAALTDSCLGITDADSWRIEASSGCYLCTREDMLSADIDEDEKQFFSTAPYWIQVVGADGNPEPVQGAEDGLLNCYVEAMMEGS